MNLQRYMSDAIRRIMAKAYRNVLSNPREAKTVFRLQKTFLHSEKRRQQVAEEAGVEVPPFLICSISTECNLSCKGCYARANGIADNPGKSTRPTLTPEQWRAIDWWLDHPEEKARMEHEYAEHAKHYNIDESVCQCEAMFREAINEQPHNPYSITHNP